jgi:hypothetical protein
MMPDNPMNLDSVLYWITGECHGYPASLCLAVMTRRFAVDRW